MKILVLAPQPFYQNRGTPIAVRMLVEELQTAGHSVDLLVFHEGEHVDLSGVNLIRIVQLPGLRNIPPGFSLKKILCDILMAIKSLRLCTTNNYDMIHAVEEAVYIGLVNKVIFKIPYIYDIDSWLSDQLIERYNFLKVFRRFFILMEKAAVSRSKGVVVVCKELEEKVRAIDETKKLLRLEDVSLLTDKTGTFEALEETIGDSNSILLYVGNLEKYQGIDLLLESFQILLTQGYHANLVIIGGNDQTIKKYEKVSEGLAISDRVFFIGPRPIENLGMYLKQAELLVSPRIEGVNTPMKIYSYMASGIPLLATRIRSHTQVLKDTNALLAEPDPHNMAAAMKDGLINKDKARAIAEEAKSLVERQYSRKAFRLKLTNFYSQF